MALINCPECGKEISDTSKACIHCGYFFNKKESILDKVKKMGKKRLLVICIMAVIVVICIVSINLFGREPIEAEACKYIRETKKVDNVKEINAVVCISKKYDGDDENTLGYVVLYSTKNDSEFAYFEKGVYKGDGKNGGDASSSDDNSFNNMQATAAIIEALEFIDEKGLTRTTCEKYYEVDEGIRYIDLIDIWEWLENK